MSKANRQFKRRNARKVIKTMKEVDTHRSLFTQALLELPFRERFTVAMKILFKENF